MGMADGKETNMDNEAELKKCEHGSKIQHIGQCPNMKSLPQDFCDDYERNECKVCGQGFKIYDEDIK